MSSDVGGSGGTVMDGAVSVVEAGATVVSADVADSAADGGAQSVLSTNPATPFAFELSERDPGPDPEPPVRLTIPADRTLVVLVRSAAGHLGARLGLSLEELDDLRLAVDEACALLLLPDEMAVTGDTLDCVFTETAGALRVTVAADARPGAEPRVGGFGWNLLSALVDDLEWSLTDGRAEVAIVKGPAVRRR